MNLRRGTQFSPEQWLFKITDSSCFCLLAENESVQERPLPPESSKSQPDTVLHQNMRRERGSERGEGGVSRTLPEVTSSLPQLGRDYLGEDG